MPRSLHMLAPILLALPLLGFGGGDDDDDGTRTVRCDRGETITERLRHLRPGTTLVIQGTCNENVVMSSPTGQFDGVTLDGMGTGAIAGPNPKLNTLELTGVANFTIRGLLVTGGFDGISVNTGSQLAIDSVVVDGAGRHGIHFQRATTMAYVINSIVQNNPGNGIIVNENSYARIGFTSGVGASETDTGPCTILGNGGHGIRVQRNSSARIYTNTISLNGQNGVNVESASYAEIATNVIDGNVQNGINVTENSTAHVGDLSGTKTEDNPNGTSVPNGQFGVSVSWGSFASGRLGTLTGKQGAASFTHGANNNNL
jgi:hypothetical protein